MYDWQKPASLKFNYVKFVESLEYIAKAESRERHLPIYFIYVGMIVIDADGKIGCGMTTNGASHKIPGWAWEYIYIFFCCS